MGTGFPTSRIRSLVKLPAIRHLIARPYELGHDVAGKRIGLVDDPAIGAALQGGADDHKQRIDALLRLVALETGDEAFG